MARYRETVTSSRSREATFDYLAHFSNIADWDPSVPSAEPLDGATAPAVGVRYSVTFEIGRSPKELVYEVTEYDRPERIRLVAEDKTFTSDDVIEVAGDGGVVSVTYDATVALKGPLKLLEPVFKLMFKRLGDKAADGLRRTLER